LSFINRFCAALPLFWLVRALYNSRSAQKRLMKLKVDRGL
jgi:hypothetical protein